MIFINVLVNFKETIEDNVHLFFLSQTNQIMRGEASMFYKSSVYFLVLRIIQIQRLHT